MPHIAPRPALLVRALGKQLRGSGEHEADQLRLPVGAGLGVDMPELGAGGFLGYPEGLGELVQAPAVGQAPDQARLRRGQAVEPGQELRRCVMAALRVAEEDDGRGVPRLEGERGVRPSGAGRVHGYDHYRDRAPQGRHP